MLFELAVGAMCARGDPVEKALEQRDQRWRESGNARDKRHRASATERSADAARPFEYRVPAGEWIMVTSVS